MPKISVALATFNEEKNIAQLLKSVKDFAWEIVAVDGNSRDRTVSLLKSFGAKVEVTENPPNFHINKNKAIKKCKGEWILQLDADEVVTPGLKKEIKHALLNNPDIYGYWLPRKNMFLGRFLTKGGQYPDYTLRLYKNGYGILPAKSVHEQAIVKGKTAYLLQPLLHYPYPDFAHYLQHFSLYTDIFASELERDRTGKTLFTFLNFMILKPLGWFLKTFIRHKGFYDGYQGFIFSFFSALRFPVSFAKYIFKKMK